MMIEYDSYWYTKQFEHLTFASKKIRLLLIKKNPGFITKKIRSELLEVHADSKNLEKG